MTNAERQQRWRDAHRPRKRHKQWDAQGTFLSPGQFLGPNGAVVAPPVMLTATQPPMQATPAAAPVAVEHHHCPHCGSALRKRAKTPTLAA